MATLKVNRSDLFPVGTSVGAYPAAARQSRQHPAGSALESQTVGADGSLTFTGLADGVPYQLWAQVAGEHRYLRVEAPQNLSVPVRRFDGRAAAATRNLRDRLALRRLLSGASV